MNNSVFNILLIICLITAVSCQSHNDTETKPCVAQNYISSNGMADQAQGGIKLIPITTPKGDFKVWTKRIGNNPSMKVLLLHGGPGMTHEIYESFEGYFPEANIEFYYYDQLGSYYSDQPEDLSLWDLDRFVEEVEQVRVALELNNDNFYLYGQSWGGILSMQYALKYQENIKGLIISNMVSSIPDYMKYSDEVLAPKLPKEVYNEIMIYEEAEDYGNQRYLDLVTEHYYTRHVIRMPQDEWPDPVIRGFKHLNPEVYVTMQGPSEFGIKGDATLKSWDVKDELHKIKTPTLTIGAEFDTMDPKHMEWISQTVKNGRYLHCPKGSHLSQFDDQEHFFPGLIQFIKDVDGGIF